MSISAFLKLVEIRTKVASVIPFAIGTLSSVLLFYRFSLLRFFILLICILCIDMATTAINNIVDYKRDRNRQGYGYQIHNAMVSHHISYRAAIVIVAVLLLIGVGLGIWLTLLTNWIVLLIGIVSFGVGILYSFGPLPISRTPLGEVFSGVFMGLVIPFVALYVHQCYPFLFMTTKDEMNYFVMINKYEWLMLLKFVIICVPLVTGIANIMLANNICDLQEDAQNRRYTLPVVAGKKIAIFIWLLLYVVAFVAVIMLTIQNIWMILAILGFVPVFINCKRFIKVQSKKDTFPLAIQNYLWISLPMLTVLFFRMLMRN